jgi:hypothetical protein
MEWCCAWSRILMTSIGVTTATASVTPAARPAEDQRMLAKWAFPFLKQQLKNDSNRRNTCP